MLVPVCRNAPVRAAASLLLTAWAICGSAGGASTRPSLATRPTGLPASPYMAFEGELSRLERDLFRDAADGRLDEHSPFVAALVASGLSDVGEIGRLEDRLNECMDELGEVLQGAPSSTDPLARAAEVFAFMHRRVLGGGYGRDCTHLGETLLSGRFNCASASLLYFCLAEHFGLEVRGLELPGHAMVRLVLPDRTLDVETTCARWFTLVDNPKAQAEMLARARGDRPGAKAGRVREVTPIQMAAMVYYNRGIDLLAAAQFSEAASANAKALRLDPASDTARGNLLATLNNWAIHLGQTKAYAEAASRLEAGFSIDPRYKAFAANYAHVHHQWVNDLTQTHRFAEAVELLRRGTACRPGDEYFIKALADVHRRWANWLFESGRIDEGFAAMTSAYEFLGRRRELVVADIAACNDHAVRLMQQERFEQAVLFLDRALARLPDAEILAENRRVAVMGWAEPAFREGDYAEAIRRTIHGSHAGRLHESLLNNVRYGYQQWIERLQTAGQADEVRRISAQAALDPFLHP